METITEITEVENQILRDSIFNLYNMLMLKMPEFFESQSYEINLYDDFAEVVWHTKTQVMAEDITDLMEKRIGANIMFASKENSGKVIKVEAYSAPVENSMYIIYVSSEQYGVVDAVTVFFFDSFETMYHRLRKDYMDITKIEADVIEKQSLMDLIGNFI